MSGEKDRVAICAKDTGEVADCEKREELRQRLVGRLRELIEDRYLPLAMKDLILREIVQDRD